MTTKSSVKWYRASEAKSGRIAHLAGHRRLGGEFSKCGKRLGRIVGSGFDPCAACAIEQNKAIERDKKRVEMEAKSPSIVHPKTPELDRMAAVKEKSHEIGAFLDWLGGEKNYTIAETHIHSDKCDGWDTHRGRFNPGMDQDCCGLGPDGKLWAIRTSKEKLLADFYGIDLDKIEAERRSMLDAIRAAA